jgi:hypothetical protein
MNDWRTLIRWLALAALADWLLSRTITRAAIFMPKSPPMLAVFQVMTVAGQLATTVAALLGIGAILWLAWQSASTALRPRAGSMSGLVLPVALVGMVALSLLGLVLPPAGWASAAYHLCYLIAMAALGVYAWRLSGAERIVAWLVVAAALALGELYQLGSTVGFVLHMSEPPAAAAWLFNAGEACVVAGAFALWWAYGRSAGWRAWLLPGALALAFAAGYFSNGEMSGVLAIWSIGLTLYLPWPLYVAALCLAGVTILVSLRTNPQVAWAILLLAAGGYAPQLSSQAFFDLVALALLAAPIRQLAQSHSSVLQSAGGYASALISRESY